MPSSVAYQPPEEQEMMCHSIKWRSVLQTVKMDVFLTIYLFIE